MAQFERIGIIGRPGHPGVVSSLVRLVAFLGLKKVKMIMDEGTANLLDGPNVEIISKSELSANCDLMIVVGGDGSILNIAKHIASDVVPVIGINRGKLGFLTDVLPDELETKIGKILSGEYSVEKRFLLDVFRTAEGETEHLGSALNDVVLHPGSAAQMIEFELFIDDMFVYSQGSDGLIVATPTGSTAYALSAGGPIMHPGLNAVVLAPMYPHSLSSRPIVVDGDSKIKLNVSVKGALQPQISCDGDVKYTAKGRDQFLITKKSVSLHLMHPHSHNFYEACRSKLGWGSRLVRTDD